jgi:hypothetical protein
VDLHHVTAPTGRVTTAGRASALAQAISGTTSASAQNSNVKSAWTVNDCLVRLSSNQRY